MLLNLTQPYSNLDCGINKGFLTIFDDLMKPVTLYNTNKLYITIKNLILLLSDSITA